MCDMDVPRTRLASRIRDRRQELRLSQAEAARLASMARNTWASAEDGSRDVRTQNYAGIERALQWAAGSVDEILGGGEPTAENAPPALPADFDLDAELDRINRLDVSGAKKLAAARALIEMYEQAQAERRAGPSARPA